MSRCRSLTAVLSLCLVAACDADNAVRPFPEATQPNAAVAAAATPAVEIVSVGALPVFAGASTAQANDVNDAGLIVGAQYGGQYFGWHPLRWPADASAPTYLINPAMFATANAITGDGQTAVGGWDILAEFPSQFTPIKMMSSNSSLVGLTARCCGSDRGQAFGVNDAAKIVGYYRKINVSVPTVDREIPALWVGATETDLLGGESSGRAYDINNSDVVVGQRTEGPFRWQNGVVTTLPTLGGAATTPLSINDAGVIVGVSGTTAVRWVNGSIAALAGIPGTNSRANDVNDMGQVVGSFVDPATTSTRAFLWSEDLGLIDLGPGTARAVNNRGVVVGTGGSIPVQGGPSGTQAYRWTLNFSPVARLTGPEEAKMKEALTFSAATSTDQNVDALTYAWDFGDGSTGSGATATHSYKKQDTYTVTVTVSDPRGLTSSASLDVSVENGKKPKKEHDNNGNGNGPKKP
ncbi:MAG TPA: PKD domain-containing protein [Gemmatimonadaceae bacterium]|nr:PKD domain-containing protein [Gemmatimonadaceae bacterium]